MPGDTEGSTPKAGAEAGVQADEIKSPETLLAESRNRLEETLRAVASDSQTTKGFWEFGGIIELQAQFQEALRILEERVKDATPEELQAIVFIYDNLNSQMVGFKHDVAFAPARAINNEVQRRVGARTNVNDGYRQSIATRVENEVTNKQLDLSADENQVIENGASWVAKNIQEIVERIVANPDDEIRRIQAEDRSAV